MELDWFFVGQDIQLQIDGEFDIEIFYDELGDLVTVNEINPSSGADWIAYDNKLFELKYSDIRMLEEKGLCRAYYIGELKEFVDLNMEQDRNFAEWYWGEDYKNVFS